MSRCTQLLMDMYTYNEDNTFEDAESIVPKDANNPPTQIEEDTPILLDRPDVTVDIPQTLPIQHEPLPVPPQPLPIPLHRSTCGVKQSQTLLDSLASNVHKREEAIQK